MTLLSKALAEWLRLQPENSCCTGSHWELDDNYQIQSKDDDRVCPRERAWRAYVRLRDGNHYFPFGGGFE